MRAVVGRLADGIFIDDLIGDCRTSRVGIGSEMMPRSPNITDVRNGAPSAATGEVAP